MKKKITEIKNTVNIKHIFNEVFYFSTLILIFGILSFVFWGHQGHVLIDCGREAYIPEQVLKGKVLFKDIFILYGPLSYQINAFLYKIFGIHLNTLYFAGLVNSFIILTVYYVICRKITSIKISWLACFLLMAICIFYHNIANYIFPYSYAIVYALSSFLISVLFCIFYIEKPCSSAFSSGKTINDVKDQQDIQRLHKKGDDYHQRSKPVFLILAAFFMGISAVSKIDFVLFSFVLLLIAFYLKPLNKKHLLFFILSFLAVPLLSWSALFIKGLKISEFLSYFQMMNDFVHSHLFKFFYSYHTGLYPSKRFLYGLSKTFIIFIFNFVICSGIFYGFFRLFSKLRDFKAKKFLQVTSFIVLYVIFPKDFLKSISETTSYGWIAVSATFILVVYLISLLKDLKFKNFFKELPDKFESIELKNKIFIIITVAAILASFKSYFFINMHIFGMYLIPLLMLINIVFLFEKIPCYLKFLHQKSWRQSCFTILFLIGMIFMITSLQRSILGHSTPVETSRGKIYAADLWGVNINKLINYIDNEVPEESSFLMMPEGLMVNFLTKRESNNWFYSLTPNFVEAFEEQIIKDIKNKKPEYIFISDQDTIDYGFQYFGKDYAKGIQNYVIKNYSYIGRLNEPKHDEQTYMWIDLYKIKS